MDTRDCTECGHETAAEGRCGHCGAPKLRGSALSGLLESRRHRIAYAVLALALAICCMAAWAEESVQGEVDAASAPPARPERFAGVTATTGREWVEQCDGAAQKTDSTARVGACVSFLQGARAVATHSNGKACDADLARQTRGDVWISTFQIARRYPALPIRKVFALAFDAIEPDSCRKAMLTAR